MTASTLTRTDLFNLSTVGADHVFQPDNDNTFPNHHGQRDYLNRGSLTDILRNAASGTHSGFRYYWTLEAAATYNEAVIENAHHDALLLNRTPADIAQAERRAQADALAVMRRREAGAIADREAADRLVRQLRSEVSELSRPVTSGSDPRMVEFWGLAADAADEAGFCPEYDRIAEIMGGEPRQSEFDYTIDLEVRTSLTVTVTAGRNFDPTDDWQLRNVLTLSDIVAEANIDWSEVTVDSFERE